MNEHGDYMDAAQPDDEWTIRCACIRISPGDLHTTPPGDPDWFYANTWDGNGDDTPGTGLYIHANSSHINVGVTQVRINRHTGYLRVDTDGAVNGVPLVTGDETAATSGLLFGASGGNGYIDIKVAQMTSTGPVFKNMASQSVYNSVASDNLNLWIAWLSPLVRGDGSLSKPDQALALLAALETRVTALEQGI